MGPIKAVTLFYTHYFDVLGRSRRSEYAWLLLAHGGLTVLIAALVSAFGASVEDFETANFNGFGVAFMGLYSLIWVGSVIPWITLNIRRFHDMNYTGWMVALFAGLWLIPPIGALASIVQFFWILFGGGTPGANKYGQDPRFSRHGAFD